MDMPIEEFISRHEDTRNQRREWAKHTVTMMAGALAAADVLIQKLADNWTEGRRLQSIFGGTFEQFIADVTATTPRVSLAAIALVMADAESREG